MRILAALGRSTRMAPSDAADVVIDMDRVNGDLRADYSALHCPTVFIVGAGAHSGATDEQVRTMRAAANDAAALNDRVSVFATTPHTHTRLLRHATATIVSAIEHVASTSD